MGRHRLYFKKDRSAPGAGHSSEVAGARQGCVTYGVDLYVEHGCKMNTKKFPFDEQTCHSLWSSLMYFTDDVQSLTIKLI